MKFLIFSLVILLSSGSYVQSRILQLVELVDDASIERQQNFNEQSNEFEEMNFIELVFAIDKGFYESVDNDMQRVLDYCNRIVINANHIFQPLNVQLIPIAIEIWEATIKNSELSALTYMKDFAVHSSQNLLKKYKFDASILLTHQEFESNVISVSMGNEICSSNNSTAVISTYNETIEKVTLAMVHEIGHMLGMGHDNGLFSNCECEDKTCIMHVFNEEPNTKWSSCSKRHMQELIKSGENHCLH